MSVRERVATVTDADVRTLAAKLKGLHALLTPAEQALLHLVLRRAAGREGPVAPDTGDGWAVSFNPFTYLDAVTAVCTDERAPRGSTAQGSSRR
jgi:hypothetical protein